MPQPSGGGGALNTLAVWGEHVLGAFQSVEGDQKQRPLLFPSPAQLKGVYRNLLVEHRDALLYDCDDQVHGVVHHETG